MGTPNVDDLDDPPPGLVSDLYCCRPTGRFDFPDEWYATNSNTG